VSFDDLYEKAHAAVNATPEQVEQLQHVAEMLAGAHQDRSVSGDAMRWRPPAGEPR